MPKACQYNIREMKKNAFTPAKVEQLPFWLNVDKVAAKLQKAVKKQSLEKLEKSENEICARENLEKSGVQNNFLYVFFYWKQCSFRLTYPLRTSEL